MNDLRSTRAARFFQPELPVCQSTRFRSYTLGQNQLFKVDNKEFVHFFFLLEGEIRISGIKSTKYLISEKEFFFIPNNRFICRSVKEARFLLFSINRFHYQANQEMYADLGPVITELRERHSPLTAPPLLHLFVEIVMGYLGDGLDSELLQTIKQQELFVILQALYSEGCDNEASICNRLSLS